MMMVIESQSLAIERDKVCSVRRKGRANASYLIFLPRTGSIKFFREELEQGFGDYDGAIRFRGRRTPSGVPHCPARPTLFSGKTSNAPVLDLPAIPFWISHFTRRGTQASCEAEGVSAGKRQVAACLLLTGLR